MTSLWAPLSTIRACNTMRNARQKVQVLLPWHLDVAPEVVLCDSCGYPCGSATETALATSLAQPLRSYASFARPCAPPFSPPLLSRRSVSQLPLSNLRLCPHKATSWSFRRTARSLCSMSLARLPERRPCNRSPSLAAFSLPLRMKSTAPFP